MALTRRLGSRALLLSVPTWARIQRQTSQGMIDTEAATQSSLVPERQAEG
jgi:hypothetical protein